MRYGRSVYDPMPCTWIPSSSSLSSNILLLLNRHWVHAFDCKTIWQNFKFSIFNLKKDRRSFRKYIFNAVYIWEFWIFCFKLLKSTQKLGTLCICQIFIEQLVVVLVTNLMPSWLVVRLVIGHQAALVTALSGGDNGIYSSNHLHLRSLFHHVDGNVHHKKKSTYSSALPVWCFDNYWYDSAVSFPASLDRPWYASGLPPSLRNIVCMCSHFSAIPWPAESGQQKMEGRSDQTGGSKWADLGPKSTSRLGQI